MHSSGFDEENGVLDKSDSMTVDECEPLSVWRGIDVNGYPVVISCWKPTDKEIQEIVRTGRVWLIITGDTMPPVQLVGHKPFTKPNQN